MWRRLVLSIVNPSLGNTHNQIKKASWKFNEILISHRIMWNSKRSVKRQLWESGERQKIKLPRKRNFPNSLYLTNNFPSIRYTKQNRGSSLSFGAGAECLSMQATDIGGGQQDRHKPLEDGGIWLVEGSYSDHLLCLTWETWKWHGWDGKFVLPSWVRYT